MKTITEQQHAAADRGDWTTVAELENQKWERWRPPAQRPPVARAQADTEAQRQATVRRIMEEARRAEINNARFAAAVHESGHALGAWALGIPLARVAISQYGGGVCADYAQSPHDHLVILWCAGLAEGRGRDPKSHLSRFDKDDIRRLAKLLDHLDFPEGMDWLDSPSSFEARQRAEAILACRRGKVLALARILLHRGEVSGREANEIFANG